MAQVNISLAEQLAEAQRILRFSKKEAGKIKAETGTLPAAKVIVLLKREAIVATLKRVIIAESPLN